jgi:putative heme degradation protein
VAQRFTGPLDAIDASADELVVRAPNVRVRVRIGRVAEAWVVGAPSLDGPSTSIELLDSRAGVVCSLAGARVPGAAEPRRWHELVDDLRTLVA